MGTEDKLPKKDKLPKDIFRDAIIVSYPELVEESAEEGVIEFKREDDLELKVVQKGRNVNLVKLGDIIIISPEAFMRPRTAFKIGTDIHLMYRESDVLGIW